MVQGTYVIPEQYNLAVEVEQQVDRSQKALLWQDKEGNKVEWTYEQLLNAMNQYAHVFRSLDLQKGDRVLLLFPRVPEAYATYLACIKAGLVIIPCSGMLRSKDLSFRIRHAEASAVIAYAGLTEEVDKMESLPSLKTKIIVNGQESGWEDLLQKAINESVSFECETHKDEVAFLPYTSGTTGNPKAVVHTHAWAYAHLQTAATEWLGVQKEDTVWATAAPGWQKWVWSPFLSVIGKGATAFIYDGPFDAQTYLSLLQEHQVTVFCATPTEYRMLAKEKTLASYELRSIRQAVSAGEPLNRAVISTFQDQFGFTVRDGYGQTENTLLIGTMIGMEARPGSMGMPTPGNGVCIINDEGQETAVDEIGMIAVHKDSPALFKRYDKDEERTKASFIGDYYVTGDQAKRDKDGYFWFEGRGDDIIISSGYTIGPFEVEDALTKHAAVKECAVVASPDEVRGSIVKAYVVLNLEPESKDELTKELQEFVKQETAPYKYPRKIEYIKELPKTISGKTRRIDLRRREQEQ
ncbi:acyl-CoA synthetase [Shouchella sp. JSM 1781072]|uniref:acyl-CoA synthetase n=1 Tax=Shouchella sp. JSM 1781072 TaxID=3344581 RepID=UPI0035BFC051